MSIDSSIAMIVARRDVQGDGVVVLDLVPEAGGALPAFEPGAHVDLELGPDLVRQYSLCSDPADLSCYRVGVLNDPASRGGSRAVFERLHEGSRVLLSNPRNLFPLDPSAAHSILIGGGIGITPMLAMASHLSRLGHSFELHYFASTAEKAAFLNELGQAPYADRVSLHFGGRAARFNLTQYLPEPVPDIHLYVCGPEGFMSWVRNSAQARGYPAGQIHQEFFSAEVDTGGEGFEIVLERSGRTVTVAAGQSIVAALKDVGVRIKVSCEQGVCGTCVCDVVEGLPDHRDVFLTDEEKAMNDQIALCCSRAKTPRLVLDL